MVNRRYRRRDRLSFVPVFIPTALPYVLFLITLPIFAHAAVGSNTGIMLIPQPARITVIGEAFLIKSSTVIQAESDSAS